MVQDVLKAKLTVSKSSGKGAMPVPSDDEAKFGESKAYGFHHPLVLLRIPFWCFIMLFDRPRGRNEHDQMLWGDAESKTGTDGQYLEYRKRLTKTRRGPNFWRAFKPVIFPTEDKTKCAVEAFKLYGSKRPTYPDPCPKSYSAVNCSVVKSGYW